MSNDRRQSRGSRRPDLLAYTVKPIGDGKKAAWSKLGAAWAHRDGKGFYVRMDALPLDGKVVLREAADDQVDAPGAAAESAAADARPADFS